MYDQDDKKDFIIECYEGKYFVRQTDGKTYITSFKALAHCFDTREEAEKTLEILPKGGKVIEY